MLWENWISTHRRLKLNHYLSPYTKIKSKENKDPNVRPETLKQIQEVIGNTLKHIGTGNDFLSRTQKTQHLRERINKWDCIKLKSKKNSNQIQETAHRMGENIFQLHIQ
jgi:hypothetical protein